MPKSKSVAASVIGNSFVNEVPDDTTKDSTFPISIPIIDEYTLLLISFFKMYIISSDSPELYRSLMYSSVKNIALRKKKDDIEKINIMTRALNG